MAERTYTHTPEHQQRIADVLRDFPGAQTRGLPAAIRDLRKRLGREDPIDVTFVPDAFRLNEETCEIELFEVEVSNPIGYDKLCKLGAWWEEWDGDGDHDWLPSLIVIDRTGERVRRDLCAIFHGATMPDLSRAQRQEQAA